MSDWLENSPIDTLQRWVGQFGITQEFVNQRREADRLKAEAVDHAQHGVAQQQYEAQMRQGLDRIQQEIRSQSQAILGNFRTGLRQIQDEIFGSQAETTADNAAVATPASPVVPSAPSAPQAPAQPAAPNYTNQTAQDIADAFGALGSGLREASEKRNQELLAQQGYVGFRKPVAADAFQKQHPDWIREEVEGESRFRPRPAGMRDNQEAPPASQTGQDLDRLTILGEFANVRTPEQAAAIIQKYGEENLRRQNIDVDFQLQIARLDPAAVRNALQGLQQPASSVPARPQGVPSIGVQTPPAQSQGPSQASQPVQSRDAQLLEEAFTNAFPGGRMTPRGELEAKVGGRTVYVGFDEARRVARLDFEADTPGVPGEMQAGSVDLMRSIKSFIGELKPTGLGLEYRAIDTNRTARKGYRRSRADIYAKMLTDAGFQQTGGPGVNNEALYVWTPIKERKVFEDREEKASSRYKQLLNREVEPRTLREAVIHAGGISTASIREQYGIKSKGERVKEGGGISLREVPFLTNLVRNEGQPLDTLATSLAHEGWFGARPSGETTTEDYTGRLLDLLENNPNLEQGGNVAEEELQKEYDRFKRAQEKGNKAVRDYLNELREQGATEQELADAIEEARRQGYSPESIAESLRSREEAGEGTSEEENPEWNQDDGLLTAEEVAANVDFDTFDEPTPEPAPSAARVTRPSTQQPPLVATTPMPGGRTAEELEADPDYDRYYEPYADIFDTFTEGGPQFDPRKFDTTTLGDTLRMLDRVSSWAPTTPNRELEIYVANKIKQDYSEEIAAARKRARQKPIEPITGPTPQQIAAEIHASWTDGEGLKDAYEAQLLAGLTNEQVQEMEEELARLVETARREAAAEALREVANTKYDTEEERRKATEAAGRLAGKEWKASMGDQRKPRGRARRGMRPGDYGSAGAGALPSSASQGDSISQYRLIANMSRRFNVPWYVHNLSKQAAAVYAMRPRAILVNNMSAGNAPVFMHEVAHDIDQKQNLFPDVNAVRALPVAVQRGLQSWDYDPSNHDETTSAAEGFAEYLRMAVTGQLGSLNANQQAAQAWINTRLQAVPGLWESLQETAADFRRFVGMTSTQQAAAGISVSGEAEKPELSNGQMLSEATTDAWTKFRQKWENDQVALEAFERTAERLGKKWKIRPSEVMFHLRGSASQYAAEMIASGISAPVFGPEGEVLRMERLGRGLDAIKEGLLPEDLTPVYEGGTTRFETYFIARHVVAEHAEGRPTVGDAMRTYYERFLAEAKQDAAFIARAEPAAQRFTAEFNAMIDARVLAGIITASEGQRMKDLRPTFAPFDRVPEASNWKKMWRKFVGNKEALDSGLRTRKGSDLPILTPFKAYMARTHYLAALMIRHTERMALIGTIKTPGMAVGQVKLEGMGDFLVEVDQPLEPHHTTVTPAQVAELLAKMGLEQDVINDMVHDGLMPAELLYFTQSPVPINGKPHLVVMEQGRPHFYRVGDMELYNLMIGKQMLPEVAPLKLFRMFVKIIKFGATSANPLFQLYNVARDSVTFARNTMDIRSIKDLPGAYTRAYIYMVRAGMGATREQLAAFDPAMTLYLSHAGEWTQQVNFDTKGIDQKYRETVKQHGITKVIDVTREGAKSIIRTIGAAEHAPRVVEMRNYLLSQGFTDAEIERAARGESGVIPEWQIQIAMVKGAEVTTPFKKLGYMSRWLNLYIPFFGPRVAGLSKGVRQTMANPKRVAMMTAIGMAIEMLHWLANKDEPWYIDQDDEQRNSWYLFRIGNTLWRFPKSREPEQWAINGMQQFLRAQSDSNPRFSGWVRHTLDQMTPPLSPAGLGTAYQIATNEDWRGASVLGRAWELAMGETGGGHPIIPRADQDLPWQENFGRRARYAFDQMTGGIVDRNRYSRVPFSVSSPPSQSMQDFYDQYSDLSSQRLAYGRANRLGDQADYSGFPQEQEFARLDSYNGLMRNFSRARSATSGETRRAIEEARVDITRTLMGRRGASMPSLASIPQEVRQETEEWLGGVLRSATQPRDPDTTRQRGESQEAFRERSRRADAQRERQRETARSIVQEWRLPPAEQERLLRETLRRQGMGGEAIMRRVGRLRAS